MTHMNTALQRVLAGTLAFVVSYVLIGLATVTRIAQYLTPDTIPGVTVLEVYRSAGRPQWQAIGWFTLNVHGIPVTVSIDKGHLVSQELLVHEGALWLGIVPGWFGFAPMVACLVVGAAVATRGGPTPSAAIGTWMAAGYFVAVLLSTYLFSGAVGPVNAHFDLIGTYPPEKWLLPVILYPLVFGSVGAYLAQSHLIRAQYERIARKILPQ